MNMIHLHAPARCSSVLTQSELDYLCVVRGRLLSKYGTLWLAAAAYGRSASWLSRRLDGTYPISDDLADWITEQVEIPL
jgi:hypothetical protein